MGRGSGQLSACRQPSGSGRRSRPTIGAGEEPIARRARVRQRAANNPAALWPSTGTTLPRTKAASSAASAERGAGPSGPAGRSRSAGVGRPFEGRTALLSPFDRLVYDRVRAQQLFGFDYQLEMYKPLPKRRWGY